MEKQLSSHTRTRLINRNGKKVREHRWLMEQQLGRELLPREHVHHINGNPLDNALDNLVVLDCKVHMNFHNGRYSEVKICEVCGDDYIAKPHKRKRQKCCSPECANRLRAYNMAKTRYGW